MNRTYVYYKGFTIIELLIAIVVIGILVSLAVVSYSMVVNNSKKTGLIKELDNANNELALKELDAEGAQISVEELTPVKNGILSLATTEDRYCIGIKPNDNKLPSYYLDSSINQIQEGECPKILNCSISAGSNFIEVPGNSKYNTNNFCVMKFEARNVGGVATSAATGTPWTALSLVGAKTASENACSGCHLITDPEWMTIVDNVINNPENWSTGVVGAGFVYSGHNDNSPASLLSASTNDSDSYVGTGNVSPSNQKRTLTLSNGEVIWDLAGNGVERTNTTIIMQPGLDGQSAYANNDYTNVNMKLNGMSPLGWPLAPYFNSSNGIGRVYSNPSLNVEKAITRGGSYNYGSAGGVLSLDLRGAPTSAYADLTFRVAK